MPTAVSSAYLESSQYQRWTIDEEELGRRRQVVHDRTVQEIRANIEEELALDPQSKLKTDFPTAEEATLIVEYYAAKVFETGALFKLPSHLKATAAAYVRRFYLAESPLRYHPKSIMVTCLFLATKTCEHHIDLDKFVEKLPKQTRDSVLEYEFQISSALNFDFTFWSAYRPLYGFVLDMGSVLCREKQNKIGGETYSIEDVGKAHEIAKASINATISSDLPFHHSPSLLALASLFHANGDLVEEYMKRIGRWQQVDKIRQLAQELDHEARASFADPDLMAQVKAIDKKLYYSKDPALTKTAILYKRRLEAEGEAESVKRRNKGNAVNEIVRDSQAAFGKLLSE